MSSNVISVKFHGRDFTKIADDLEDEIKLTETRTLNKDEQLKLIIKFLNGYKDKIPSLIIDSGKKQELSKDKQELYTIFNDEYWWSGLVGIVKGRIRNLYESDLKDINEGENNKEYGEVEVTVQIQSRFDIDSLGNRAKPYFLTTMLLKCQSGINDTLVPNNSDDFFFDLLLLYLFKEKANNCYLKGLYKTYQRFEKNNDRLKGSIDIPRHIRMNMGLDNGMISYSYKENTVDNYLNHLIICAFEKLKRKYPESVYSVYNDDSNPNFKFFIESIKFKIQYPIYDSRTLISKNLAGISHPYYTEYEDIRKISLKILRDEGVSMFDGNADEVNGILFYIADLWELYIEHLLVDNKYKLYSQGLNSDPIKIINYKNDLAKFKQTTFPDYVFAFRHPSEDKEKLFMILDAKFKPAWADIINAQKSLSSVLEDYDKCIRDMNSINAHACGTVFPTNIDMSDRLLELIRHDISEFNKIDKFFTFPIIVPASDNKENVGYSSWYDTFESKNKKIIDLIKECVLEEKKFVSDNYDLLKQINSLR